MTRLATLLSATRLWRPVFFAYAALLFVGTHWPALHVDVPGVERPDLIVHLLVFGLWGVLFTLTAFAGPPGRPRAFAIALLLGLVYAAIDEGLQAIPALKRNAALDDYAANSLGLLLGMSAASLAARLAQRRAAASSPARSSSAPR